MHICMVRFMAFYSLFYFSRVFLVILLNKYSTHVFYNNFYYFYFVKQYLILFILISTLLFDACIKPSSNVPKATAKIMFLNTVPNTTGFDLYMDDKLLTALPLLYKTNTLYTDYLIGNRNIKIRHAGTNNIVLDTTVTLYENMFSTYLIYDSVHEIKLNILNDKLVAPSGSKTTIRFLNTSPNIDSVDISFDSDTTALCKNVYKAQPTSLNTMDAGTLDFKIKYPSTQTLLYDMPPRVFESGKIYTVILFGNNGGTILVDELSDNIIINSNL